jgi:uncharacterized membrane protein
VENIVLGFVLGATTLGFITLIIISVRLLYVISEMATIVKSIYISTNKIEQMSQATMQASENFVDALSSAVQDPEIRPHTGPNIFKMFSSEDGRHTASTFESLLEKMKKDPNYNQMSNNDIEEIRKLFEDNSEEDDADDTDTLEPWKK